MFSARGSMTGTGFTRFALYLKDQPDLLQEAGIGELIEPDYVESGDLTTGGGKESMS